MSDSAENTPPGSPQRDSKKRRKLNFSREELNILVEAIIKYDRLLHGPQSHKVSAAKKRRIQQNVADSMNAVGKEHRTPQDIRKRWNDMTRHTREKLASIREHARGTGGGPPCNVKLTEMEERVSEFLTDDQTYGLEGVDSAERRQKKAQGPRKGRENGASTSSGWAVTGNPLELQAAISRAANESEEESEHLDEEEIGSPTMSDAPPVSPTQPTDSLPLFDTEEVVQEEDIVWDISGVLREEVVEPPETPLTHANVDDMHSGRKKQTGKSVPPSHDPTEWERKMMADQQVHTEALQSLNVTMSDMCAQVSQGTASIIQTLKDCSEVQSKSIAEGVGKIEDSMQDGCANQCAMVATLSSLEEGMSRVSESVEALLTSSREHVAATQQIAVAINAQTTCLSELTSETRALVQALTASNALRESATRSSRVEARHTRRLMRQQGAQAVRLHHDACAHMHRIGLAVELLQPISEATSGSTTPSDIPPPVSTVQGGAPLPTRELRRRKGKRQ